MTLNLLGISGSLRRQSCNTGLLRAAQRLVPDGVKLELADLSDIPFYNADIQDRPESVVRVLGQMAWADAFVLALFARSVEWLT
jgi:chromate reductase